MFERFPKLDVGSNVCHATERLHDNPQRPLIETNRVAIALNAAIDTSDNSQLSIAAGRDGVVGTARL